MTKHNQDMSQSTSAKIAVIGYLFIFILAIFANFFVLNQLIVREDAQATLNNILASEGLFRIGICSFIVVTILDVVVAMALYIFFKPVNKNISLLAAWFRLIHAIIFAIAIVSLIIVINILNDTTFNTSEVQKQIMIFLDAFNFKWLIGLVFFGIHLFLLGYLIFKADFIPNMLGVLLIAAAFGYLIDSFAHFLIPNYNDYQEIFLIIVAVPGIIGEMSFCLWLLIKGSGLSEIDEGSFT